MKILPIAAYAFNLFTAMHYALVGDIPKTIFMTGLMITTYFNLKDSMI